jgi:elongation factor P
MGFLYRDGDECYFMDPESYEQIAISAAVIGEQANFLKAEMQVPVEFLGETPVSVQMPEIMEVRIADTTPPVHAQQDSTWKTARLENGVEIMVPQFIKSGDLIRLDLATMKYMDRAKTQGK